MNSIESHKEENNDDVENNLPNRKGKTLTLSDLKIENKNIYEECINFYDIDFNKIR